MQHPWFCLGMTIAVVAALGTPCGLAAPLVLDFETPETGATLDVAPLMTPFGTVSLTNATTIGLTGAGPGNGVLHNNFVNPGPCVFTFGGDLDSIQFWYTGEGAGTFQGQAFDSSHVLLDAFLDPDTARVGEPFGPVVLTGPGIRSFEFLDTAGALASVDGVRIAPHAPAVPEPAGIAAVSLGAMALLLRRRG